MRSSSLSASQNGREAILLAWHEGQVTRHLEQLAEARDQAGDPGEWLEAVLEADALISHEHHSTELAALLHGGEHVARAQQLNDFIRDLLTEGAETGDVRMTSRLMSLLATVSTPSQQPAACRPRLPPAGSSRSFWVCCVPRRNRPDERAALRSLRSGDPSGSFSIHKPEGPVPVEGQGPHGRQPSVPHCRLGYRPTPT